MIIWLFLFKLRQTFHFHEPRTNSYLNESISHFFKLNFPFSNFTSLRSTPLYTSSLNSMFSFHSNSSTVLFPDSQIYNLEINERVSNSQTGRFQIVDTIFANCYASYAQKYGGALFISGENRQLTIFRSGFLNNSAESSGGSIFYDGSQVSVFGCCFTLSKSPKFFDLQITSDQFTFNCTSLYRSSAKDHTQGESSLGIDKSRVFISQANTTKIISPIDSIFINAKNFVSLTSTFTLISECDGHGLCLLISPSKDTFFTYLTIKPNNKFNNNQPIFFSTSQFLLKDSNILTEDRICQESDSVIAKLHSCCVVGIDENW